MFATVRHSLFALLATAALASTAMSQEAVLSELYGRGVHAYFEGNLTKAQQDLSTAIDGGLQDPRAFYFRGLTYYRQGFREAANDDFRTGATLEAEGTAVNYPVSKSLQRVQGRVRLTIEEERRMARLTVKQKANAATKARFEAIDGARNRVEREDTGLEPDVDVLPPPTTTDPTDPFGGADAGGAPPAEPMNVTPPPAAPMDNSPFGAPAAPADNNPFGGAAPAAPADDNNPFGGAAPAAPAAPADDNPFGGAAPAAPADDDNPFGGAAPAAPADDNPFGGAAPAAPADDNNPFGGAPAAPPADDNNPFGGAAPAAPADDGNNPFGGVPPAEPDDAGNPFGGVPPAEPAPGNAAAAGGNDGGGGIFNSLFRAVGKAIPDGEEGGAAMPNDDQGNPFGDDPPGNVPPSPFGGGEPPAGNPAPPAEPLPAEVLPGERPAAPPANDPNNPFGF